MIDAKHMVFSLMKVQIIMYQIRGNIPPNLNPCKSSTSGVTLLPTFDTVQH